MTRNSLNPAVGIVLYFFFVHARETARPDRRRELNEIAATRSRECLLSCREKMARRCLRRSPRQRPIAARAERGACAPRVKESSSNLRCDARGCYADFPLGTARTDERDREADAARPRRERPRLAVDSRAPAEEPRDSARQPALRRRRTGYEVTSALSDETSRRSRTGGAEGAAERGREEHPIGTARRRAGPRDGGARNAGEGERKHGAKWVVEHHRKG